MAKVYPPAQRLHRRISGPRVANVQEGDIEALVGNEKAKVRQIEALVLAALDGFHMQRTEINLGRTGKLSRLRRAPPRVCRVACSF